MAQTKQAAQIAISITGIHKRCNQAGFSKQALARALKRDLGLGSAPMAKHGSAVDAPMHTSLHSSPTACPSRVNNRLCSKCGAQPCGRVLWNCGSPLWAGVALTRPAQDISEPTQRLADSWPSRLGSACLSEQSL